MVAHFPESTKAIYTFLRNICEIRITADECQMYVDHLNLANQIEKVGL